MNKFIIAVGFSIVTSTAMADSFAPWNSRAHEPVAATTSSAEVVTSGFAPWRDRATRYEVMPPFNATPQDVPMAIDFGSAFRPWHMPS